MNLLNLFLIKQLGIEASLEFIIARCAILGLVGHTRSCIVFTVKWAHL